MNEREIFVAALAKPSPAERAAFLDQTCGGDAGLRSQVEALLHEHEQLGSFLEPPLARTVDEPIQDRPGAVIGAYKLLEEIGEGGFGVVFMAEQTAPVRRKVALKILKPGMDSRQVVARFEAERQALAIMDHPNIAKVFDGGMTGIPEPAAQAMGAPLALASGSGRPYFVMELVKGVPITEYCDQNHLTPRQRLGLFIPICQAVQHAHQKGIIHRDLKPSNILVTVHDTTPVPKVIDFGVAKALGQELTEKTMFTGFAQMLGTPLYMSPEQAGQSGLDIDTRSDIYSLGVLLYELLTGTTPFDKDRFKKAAFDEIRRIIREEEPPKPSTRLSDSKDSLPSISAQRHTEPAKLTKLVRGELDWIVMKALEKDRNRRYESANAFAADVQRYLADETVQACPPSAWYRFRKFARRNKGALAAAAAGVLLVLLVIVGLAVNNWLVTREKQQKEAALERAVQEKERADQNLARARQAVKEYLLKTSDSPLLKTGDFQKLRQELLETSLPFYVDFVRQSHDDPELEAERGHAYEDLGFVRRELGNLDQSSAEFEQAEAIFRRLAATFPDRPIYQRRVADALISRGDNGIDLGRIDRAEQLYRQALDLLEPLAAEQKDAEYRVSLARVTNSLGLLLKESSRLRDAEKMIRRSITLREKLVEEQPQTLERRGQLAQSWVNLGALLYSQRQADDAAKAFQQAIDLLDPGALEKLGAGSPASVKYQQIRSHAFNNLGVIHRAAKRYDEAEKASRAAVAIKEELADQFPSVPQYRQELARSLNNLGIVLASAKRPKDAQTAYERAISISERLSADATAVPLYAVELAGTYTNLGRLVGDSGRLEESLPSLTKSVDILESAFRHDQRLLKVRESLLVAHWTRAMTLAGLRRFAPAAEDWSRAIDLDDGHYHSSLRLKRASTFLNLKDHARATADAQAVGDSQSATGADLYDATCVYAISARLAAEDASRAETYGSHAVQLLRRAIAKGHRDLAQFKKDADLDSLRSREDFKKLMKELEDGGKASGKPPP